MEEITEIGSGKSKEWLETRNIDEDILKEARIFFNNYYGLTEHPLTEEQLDFLMNYDTSLKLDAILWKAIDPKDQQAMNAYYRITPFSFLKNLAKSYDNMHSEIFNAVEDFIIRDKAKTIIDFGGGSGILSIWLYKKGYDVTFCEMSKISVEWMRHITKKKGWDIKIIDGGIEPAKEKYDMLICKDVIEHVKDAKGFMSYLGSLSNRCLVIPITCGGPLDYEPMHFKVNLREYVK